MIDPATASLVSLSRASRFAVAVCLLVGSWALADDGPPSPDRTKRERQSGLGLFHRSKQKCGTLGYGPPGLHSGFQGFGLGYHQGYGYGGDALGVEAEGGHPFYGGPGYPHPDPCLRRLGGITPFAYYAGHGYPSPDHPNFYGGFGPNLLIADQPVVRIEGERIDPGVFGGFTGGPVDPERRFAPFTSAAGGVDAGSDSMVPSTPAVDPTAPVNPAAAPFPTTDDSAIRLPANSATSAITAKPSVGSDRARKR